MASRKQAKLDRHAQIAAMRARERARKRNVRIAWLGGGGVVVIAAVVAIVLAVTSSSGPAVTTAAQVMPPGVSGQATVQPPAQTVANTTGISGVVAYVTTGWPASSNNGPADKALRHNHVPGPVTYSVSPPVGGDHNATWMNCGVYTEPVPSERAVHNLEHGAIWITYQPSLPKSQLDQLYALFARQTVLTSPEGGSSRYMDITPYPGLPSPVVVTSWGFQLKLTSASDPRLQQFIDKFRYSKRYSPEYGGPCTGGVGTPLKL
jgi:Protein of unknown function (DUF3105)